MLIFLGHNFLLSYLESEVTQRQVSLHTLFFFYSQCIIGCQVLLSSVLTQAQSVVSQLPGVMLCLYSSPVLL